MDNGAEAVPFWIKCPVLTVPDSDSVDLLELKCWRYRSRDMTVWKLEEFTNAMQTFDHPDSCVPVNEFLRRRNIIVDRAFIRIGFNMEDHIIKNKKSFAAQVAAAARLRKPAPIASPSMQEEIVCTTIGILMLLRTMMANAHNVLERQRARHMIMGFLGTLIPLAIRDDVELLELSSLMRVSLCDEREVGEVLCLHMTTVRDFVQQFDWDGGMACAALQLYAEICHHCPSVYACDQHFLRTLSVLVHERVQDVSYTSDPVRANFAAVPSCKRRRVDEDLKNLLAARPVTTAGSVGNRGLAAELNIDKKQIQAAEENQLVQYQSSAWLSFRTSRAVHIAIDGSRFGQPAKELEIAYAYASDKNVGAWLPPQVIVCHSSLIVAVSNYSSML